MKIKFCYIKWVIAILVVFFAYISVVLKPNTTMFGNENDGLKNYYTFSYFVNYNKPTDVILSGMNYPFGEHIVFTDNIPILASLGSFLNQLGLPIAENTVGIINFLLLVNVLFSIIIICFGHDILFL